MSDHAYRFLKVVAESPKSVLVDATCRAIEKKFPNCEQPSEHFVGACAAAANIFGKHGESPLFILARVLKGSLPVGSRDMPYTSLLPYAIIFTEIMDLWHDCPVYIFNPQECVDLEDDDTLEILFEHAWKRAIFGMDFEGVGEDLLSMAIQYSAELPETYFKGISSNHKRRLLGIAEYLQDYNGGPFLLPQTRLTKALEIPQSTLSVTIHSLIDDGFLQVSAKAIHLQRKAQWYTFKSPNQSRSKKKKPPIK